MEVTWHGIMIINLGVWGDDWTKGQERAARLERDKKKLMLGRVWPGLFRDMEKSWDIFSWANYVSVEIGSRIPRTMAIFVEEGDDKRWGFRVLSDKLRLAIQVEND